jgi:hypothetical protein
VAGQFCPGDDYQGYPDRLHGCIAAGLLDEAMGQTAELHLRYRAPVPLNQSLRIVARVTRDIRRIYEGTAELKLADGTVAVEASGKYFSLIGDTLHKEELDAQEWKVYPAADEDFQDAEASAKGRPDRPDQRDGSGLSGEDRFDDPVGG